MVAALRIAGIGERVRRQPAKSAIICHDMNILDEVGRRRTAMAPYPQKITRLDDINDRLEVRSADVVHTLGVNDGPVGKNLEEHPELAAIVGAAQGKSRQQRVGRGNSRADPGLG